MWGIRAAVGRGSASRATVCKCPPSTIELLNLLKGAEILRTCEGVMDSRDDTCEHRSFALRMVAPPLGVPTCLLRVRDRLRFQPPETVIGVEKQLCIDRLASFGFELAPYLAQFPDAHGGMRLMTIRDREILLEVRIVEVDAANVTWITTHNELALASAGRIARVRGVDPGAQHVVIVLDRIDDDPVGLHRPLFIRHQVEAQPGLIKQAIREPSTRRCR